MKLLFAAFFLFSLLSCTLARPNYKDIDYRLFQEVDDGGIAIDAVYEVVDPETKPHHHHHHHKKMAKSNRLDRLKRYLQGFEEESKRNF
ncbi:hypothetical protein L3Y34_013997 [Caenorhabditis briggsae]|uniref:Uncharacterized protein n=1 Tax=Caenorhabditis briggsae TaxID=6238 RepID=A0AAE9DPP4_CAEBR|nr:hypothetical protein L3Y34_013997 [Caenorhabditis briggsae]